MSEGNEDKEKNTKNNFMKNIWFDKSFGKCYLNECEGEVDIGAIEKKINCKIKEVYLEENSKNISLTNYSLPLRLNFYDSVRSLEELKEIVNLNWLHDNKEVSLSVSNVEKNLLAEHATDPFIRKTAWNLVSGRGNRICVVYGIERLIDISDLDQIIDNYDYSRFAGMRAGNEEDVEYHQKLFGGREKFAELYTAFDNLSNRIKARNLIIVSRLLADKEDLAAGKYQLYEEKMNELAQGFQQCHKMFPGNKNWTKEDMDDIVQQALTPDYELLSRLADLPYISQWVKDRLAEREREREITTQKELLPEARESKPIEYQIITKKLKLKKPPSSPENKRES